MSIASSPPRLPGNPPPSSPTSGSVGPSIDPFKILVRYKFLLLSSVVLGIGFGIGLFVALGRVAPKYVSKIVFQVVPAQQDVSEITAQLNTDELLRFVNTQVATFSQPFLLDLIAQDPRLPAEAPGWVKEFDLGGGVLDYPLMRERLSEIISARPESGSQLFTVLVAGPNPNEPFAIASIVQDVYSRDLAARSSSELRRRTGVLQAGISDARSQAEDLTRELNQLIDQEELESLQGGRSVKRGELDRIVAEMITTSNNITQLKTLVESSEARNQPGRAIDYSESLRAQVDEQRIVIGQRQQIEQIKLAIKAIELQGITPQHRDHRRRQAELQAAELRLQDVVEQELIKLYNAQLESQKQAIVGLEAQLAEYQANAKALEAELAKDQQTLNRAEELRRLIAERRQYQVDRQAEVDQIEGVIAGGNAARVLLYQPATKPNNRAFPQLIPMLALGVFGVCGLVGGAVVTRELLDQRVKGPSDVAMIPRTRVVGMLPLATEDPTQPKRFETIFRDAPNGVLAESFRQLRTSLLKRLTANDRRSLLVVPGMPGSGATSLISNIAFAVNALDRRVLIIDANFRRPGQHKVFGLDEEPGLSDVLSDQAAPESAVNKTEHKGLDVLTAGARSLRLPEHLGNGQMVKLLTWAASRYDLVLVDVAPAVVSGDNLALAGLCDASILVTRAMAEKRGMVARLKNELTDARAEFLGVLVNAVRGSASGYMRSNIRASFEYQTPEPVKGPPGGSVDRDPTAAAKAGAEPTKAA